MTERPVGSDDIAVVGMSGRFAAAADLAAFREAVLTGDSLIGPVPEGRFGWILPPRGAMAQARGGFIADVDRFDAALFGIGDREAARMDPQSRLLLQACRATLEDAGHAPRGLAGCCVGVFVANTFQEWVHRLRQPGRVERIRLTDMTICMLASRIARAFDLRGSAEVVNAACSGGLLAVHRACMALRAGECEAALAGGVSLILAGDGYLGEARAGMLSADGRSLAFDSAGNGFVRGEGVGVLLLKTLARARADRDAVHAVIRGSAAGHGGAAGGYNADAAASQADAVARALRSAGVDPASIGYLELQAAGRPSEEAAELAVIAAGFRQAAAEGAPLPQPLTGALKPLTGHMEAASGLAQLVKVAAILRDGVVPPIGGLSEAAEAVRAAWPGLGLPVAALPWPDQATPRRALVSGYGFGGSHVHLVLEAAPDDCVAMPPAPRSRQPRAFLLSAATQALLADAAGQLASALSGGEVPPAEDVAFTLLVGRDAMPERLAILAEDVAGLTEQLAAFAAAPDRRGSWRRGRAGGGMPLLGAAEEDRDWLSRLIQLGHWPKLASLWCSGLEIDWPALADVLPGRRVSLPPMPLAATRFWMEDDTAPAAIAPAPAPSIAPGIAPGSGEDRPREILLGLLAETLGVADTASWADTDSPAALGLDSMAAAELRGRIVECCGGEAPPLAMLLQAPDLRALLALVPPIAEGARKAPVTPDPAARYAPFPTTDIQFAYLMGRQEGRQHGGFGCQVYWEFDRPRFDVERLTEAWNRLVIRHDMLRVIFAPDATQRVLPTERAGPIEIPLHDWSAASADVAARERAALAERFRTVDFDPGQFPLFRLAVTRDAAGDRLHLALDLLVADGPSLFLLMEEWAALYEAPDRPLAPLSLGFRDYVLAQKQWEQDAAAAADLAYWEARLDSLPGPPALPILPGPPPGRPAFLRHEEVLPLAVWRRFEQAAAAHGVTANAALMAALAESIAAWAERPEFCLNVTLAGRRPIHPEVFRLVGDFTSNVLLAVPARGERDFATHAAALAAQLAADIEHAGCSAVKVLGQLARRRQAPVTMPVVFTAVHGYGALLKRPVRIDAIGAYRAGATRTPQVWLDAQSLEAADGLHLSWDAMERVFAPDILADMFGGFVARVRRLAELPEAWVAPPPGTVPAPLRSANATAARLPWEPVFAGILRQAETAPQREAVIAQDRRLDFATLVGEATMLAARIQAAGVVQGQLVGVVMPKGWRQVVAVLAIGLAGAAYVPVELPLPPARIRSLLQRAGVALALTHAAPEGLDWPCAATDLDTLVAAAPLPWRPCRPAASDLAYVLFTSGSTGEPKGVALQHGAVSNTLHDVNGRFGVGPEDRVLGLSSLGFDLSVWDIFGVLGAGGALVLPAAESVRDPAHLAALLAREQVTLWNSTPSYLKLVVEAPGIALAGSLRLLMLSGDWIPLPLARRLRAEYPAARLVSLGGATEAAIWSIWHPVDRVEEGWRSVPYGRAMANQRFYVLDEAQRACPIGEVGQLHIGGAGLAAGYWRDEASTAASFIRHPETGERLYRTGDYGRVLADGGIEFLGRRDAQVKIGGHRIELAEVEAGLQAVPEMLEAVAFPVTDPGGNQRLVAAYRHRSGLAESEIRAALAASLPSYMVPGLLLPLERMPLTENGKVDRKELTALALRRMTGASAAARDSTPPATAEAPPTVPVEQVADLAARVAGMLGTAGVISDKDGRDRFVAGAPAMRRDLVALPSLAFPVPTGDAPPVRVSTRHFRSASVTQGQLAALLAPLREVATEQGPRRRYGSAGSSYAVQLYLLVGEQGCEGLAAGLWHYLPALHRLVHLGPAQVQPSALHVPFNRSMAAAAAVSLLLIGDLAAIRPLYGEMAEELLRIEAGCISQLLADAAAAEGLGLCAIGWLDIVPLRSGLRLSPDHIFLHAMVGGQPAAVAEPGSVPIQLQPQAAIGARPARQDRWVALVRKAWEEALEHSDFADDANFFEVGGNSFLAVALQARLAQTLNPAPSVTDLFRYPTVLSLAVLLAGSDGAPQASALPVSPPAGLAEDPLAARRARRNAARRPLAHFATAVPGGTWR
ncbi:non-ribosomal peptide synthetase [Siccirubricoccus deserti]|uniref:Amino acid adenylation domain-containing protein n=1 Tax=Siccirubricoccus deserti TaxID=2013562 RepID=A0A9X0UIL3_9PROT|nr:non-ribosomal peptide synthetase [Siccirubricoccus deserti]MBC4017185.1 amino acid adenylation domain-containing protein [Siccirubricoccus deserti]